MTSRRVLSLSSALIDLERVLAKADVLVDPKRRVLVDLAAQRIEEHVPLGVPGTSGDSTRGGSSSPTELEDRIEAARVGRQAALDAEKLGVLVKTIKRASTDLLLLVQRQTSTLHPDKLPAKDPGCVSCARTEVRRGERIGGHFGPVADRAI